MLKKTVFKIFVLSLFFCFLVAPVLTLAAAEPALPKLNNINTQLANFGKDGVGFDTEAQNKPDALFELIGSIINITTILAGVVLTILLVYAGGLWMMAAGNEEKVTKAKVIAVNAIIAALIIGCAFAIFQLIFYFLSGYESVSIG